MMTTVAGIRTVAICDTEPIAIEGIRHLLRLHEELRFVGGETSLLSGMDIVREMHPSVVIIEKGFGTHVILDWVGKIAASGSATASVVWGYPIHRTEALQFMTAGARGVLRKTSDLQTILDCIRTVANGGNWLEDATAYDPDRSARGRQASLTIRERQVLDLVEQGLRNKEIAALLGIQPGTVKIHLKHIFEKTGIRGRYGLALSGLKARGLAPGSPV